MSKFNAKFAGKDLCPVCCSTMTSRFLEISDVPVHIGLLWSSKGSAIHAPKGDITLGFCPQCNFVTNLTFEPALLEYTQAYENSLDFSPSFQEYARSLALQLIKRYGLVAKDLIEIGSGKGNFLRTICELGKNRGVGFDPSYESEMDQSISPHVTFLNEFYSEHHSNLQVDFIVCRHVLEHIYNPIKFLNMVRRNIGEQLNTALYFEVPNFSFILNDLAIWDIIYEHCSYFDVNSLARLFTSCAFLISAVTETYAGQWLAIEALPNENGNFSKLAEKESSKDISNDIIIFSRRFREKLESWHERLKEIDQAGQTAVVWGAGAKGVSFFNMLKIQDQIEYVVDLNPHKQGMYLPGTGQRIVSPEFLKEYRPDFVIVMNQFYQREIQQLVSELGLTCEFLYA